MFSARKGMCVSEELRASHSHQTSNMSYCTVCLEQTNILYRHNHSTFIMSPTSQCASPAGSTQNVSEVGGIWIYHCQEDTSDIILKLINSTSLCACHCLLQFRVVHTGYISQTKSSCFYPDVHPCRKLDLCQKKQTNLYNKAFEKQNV